MPYRVTKTKQGGYRVVQTRTGEVLAKNTKVPQKLIAAVEISKAQRRKK